ncbi:MAG: hypothetical protein ACRC5H_04030 [Treponemataceae bacterium]
MMRIVLCFLLCFFLITCTKNSEFAQFVDPDYYVQEIISLSHNYSLLVTQKYSAKSSKSNLFYATKIIALQKIEENYVFKGSFVTSDENPDAPSNGFIGVRVLEDSFIIEDGLASGWKFIAVAIFV